MWENFLGGLGKFASSGLGQTAIGAGLGYGLDKLAGGEGTTGALLGGAGGLLNYGSGAGGNMFGEGQGGFDSTYIGGLFGQPTQQAGEVTRTGLDPFVSNVGKLPQVATPQAIPAQATQQGLFQNFQGLGGLGDLAKGFGNLQQGLAQRDLSQAEIDYRNRVAALNEQAFSRDFANQAATNQAAIDAFNKSKLSNYYSA